MYEKDPDTGKLDFKPQTRSRCRRAGWRRWSAGDPLDVLGYQYDIVCNGVELSSGAVRNHKPEIMYQAFEIVGYDRAHRGRRTSAGCSRRSATGRRRMRGSRRGSTGS